MSTSATSANTAVPVAVGIPWFRKLQQGWRAVRASHANRLTGTPRKPVLAGPGQTGVTFIGHSSFLLQTAGKSLLVDPVFATRLILMRRQRRPGTKLHDLPPIDAVLLTHAHMDHLNLPTLRAVVREMRRRGVAAPVAIVPRGVGDLLARIGFAAVHEIDWWEATTVGPLTVTATPAKHWGARLFSDTHRGFGGYTIAAAGAPTLYHSGDTAWFNGFREIRERLHPDVALLPIGAYSPDTYRAVHTNPEEAFRAFRELGAHTMVPMHFGTFILSHEPMTEPPIRLMAAAAEAGMSSQVRILGEGETFFPERL